MVVTDEYDLALSVTDVVNSPTFFTDTVSNINGGNGSRALTMLNSLMWTHFRIRSVEYTFQPIGNTEQVFQVKNVAVPTYNHLQVPQLYWKMTLNDRPEANNLDDYRTIGVKPVNMNKVIRRRYHPHLLRQMAYTVGTGSPAAPTNQYAVPAGNQWMPTVGSDQSNNNALNWPWFGCEFMVDFPGYDVGATDQITKWRITKKVVTEFAGRNYIAGA